MTPEQNAQLQALLPRIAELDALGRALAEVERHLRDAEDFLAPIVRQWQEAQEEVRRLTSFGWHGLAAAFSGTKTQRVEAARSQAADAERLMQEAQAKLQPLQEEMRQLEERIAPLKPVREDYEKLLRTKETWVKRQPDSQDTHRRLAEVENQLYRTFIALDPVLVAVRRAESVMNDLRHTLDTRRRGEIGYEAVPLLKNLREIMVNLGAAYMRELVLIDRCYAYAAQSTKLMLAQEEEGRQLVEQLRQFGRQVAEDFLQARAAWQDAQRERIQYVESRPVA